ncbi:MAG: hypothetical protein ABI321_05140 [Polyangia bacterium]
MALLALLVGVTDARADAPRVFGIGFGFSGGYVGASLPGGRILETERLDSAVYPLPVPDLWISVPVRPRLTLGLWLPLGEIIFANALSVQPLVAWGAIEAQVYLLAPQRGLFLAPGIGVRRYGHTVTFDPTGGPNVVNTLVEPELALRVGYEWARAHGHVGIAVAVRPSVGVVVETALPRRVGIGGGVLAELSFHVFVLRRSR